MGEKREIPTQDCKLRSGNGKRAGKRTRRWGEDPCRRAVPALTHEVPHAQNPRLWAASPQAQALPDKAGTALAALRHPWPVLPAASELKRVPQPSSRITIRQHSAFCNLMLLYPNLFSWKRTKACWFYDVNPQILGV